MAAKFVSICVVGGSGSRWSLLKDKEVVVLEQIVVCIPGLGGRGVIDSGKLVKDARRRLGSIIEEEHNPEVNERSVL